MPDVFQLSKADGSPDWTPGRDTFDATWDRAYDLLRFHRGGGFRISEGHDKPGPLRGLREVHDLVGPRIKAAAHETVFRVESEKDGYAVLLRRHASPLSKGEMVLAHAQDLIGTPYVFGVTDCSWLTMRTYGYEGVDLPHNAHLQHLNNQVIDISRDKIEPGDLLFHHDDDHVSLYLDGQDGGRVIDTEPHDTASPWGGNLGTGVRVRPMSGNYYCSWQWVNGIGRVRAING